MVKGPAKNAQFFFTTEFVMPKYGFRSFMDALNTGRTMWKALTDEEKLPWKQKEQQWKEYMRGPAGDKYRKDCSGKNMQEELDRQKEKRTFEEYVRQYSISYIKQRLEVLEQPFYFIAFEYALQDDHGKHYPCEVGLVKYSLKRGIEKYVHYFLKPGEYPLGTKAAAKKHCEERHKIPYLGFEKATDGYSAVFAHMRDVLLNTNSGATGGVGDGYPPIFCMPTEVAVTRSCLNALFDHAQRHESERIKVVNSAAVLLSELFGKEVCGEAKAMEILSSTVFDHEKGVACDWHYDLECVYCALATARKIAFALSDSLKTTYNLTLTANHLPTVAELPTLAPADQFVSFEAPGRRKGWKSGTSSGPGSVVSTASARYHTDSVVSGYASRVGQQNANPRDNLANEISQMNIGTGRGRGSYAPPSRPGTQIDADQFDDDDEWTTVSSHRNQNARNQNSTYPAQQQAWGRTVADDWEIPVAPPAKNNFSNDWGDDEDDIKYKQSQPNSSVVSSGWRNDVVDDDDSYWEGASVTSSTALGVQPAASAWGGASSGSSVVSSNPYARAPAVGRGRGLSMGGK